MLCGFEIATKISSSVEEVFFPVDRNVRHMSKRSGGGVDLPIQRSAVALGSGSESYHIYFLKNFLSKKP